MHSHAHMVWINTSFPNLKYLIRHFRLRDLLPYMEGNERKNRTVKLQDKEKYSDGYCYWYYLEVNYENSIWII